MKNNPLLKKTYNAVDTISLQHQSVVLRYHNPKEALESFRELTASINRLEEASKSPIKNLLGSLTEAEAADVTKAYEIHYLTNFVMDNYSKSEEEATKIAREVWYMMNEKDEESEYNKTCALIESILPSKDVQIKKSNFLDKENEEDQIEND